MYNDRSNYLSYALVKLSTTFLSFFSSFCRASWFDTLGLDGGIQPLIIVLEISNYIGT